MPCMEPVQSPIIYQPLCLKISFPPITDFQSIPCDWNLVACLRGVIKQWQVSKMIYIYKQHAIIYFLN